VSVRLGRLRSATLAAGVARAVRRQWARAQRPCSASARGVRTKILAHAAVLLQWNADASRIGTGQLRFREGRATGTSTVGAIARGAVHQAVGALRWPRRHRGRAKSTKRAGRPLTKRAFCARVAKRSESTQHGPRSGFPPITSFTHDAGRALNPPFFGMRRRAGDRRSRGDGIRGRDVLRVIYEAEPSADPARSPTIFVAAASKIPNDQELAARWIRLRNTNPIGGSVAVGGGRHSFRSAAALANLR